MRSGWANSINKTLPDAQERNKDSSEHRRRVIGIPVIVEPVVVPVPLAVIPVQVENVPVTVRVEQDCIGCHLCHCSLNTLRAVFYATSSMS